MAPTLDFTKFRAEDGSNTKRRIQGIYTGPAVYPAGGDPFLPADAKLGQIDLVLFEHPTNGTVVLICGYEVAAKTVKWYDLTGAEITNGTDLSTYAARFEAIGR